MSELVYQEQSVSDLEYKLFKVKEFQQQLTILKQKSLTWQDYLVSFAIIGSSHLVKIDLANQKLIEILACEAVTSIEIFNSLRELKWVTYHSYAEEKQVVKTITSLTR